MAKATITIEDIDANQASLVVNWHGTYDETSGAHRLAGTMSGAVERTGPVEDIHGEGGLTHPDDNEGGTHD